MAIPTKPTTATISGAAATDDYLPGTSDDDIITGGVTPIAYSADGIDIMQGGAGDDQYIVNDSVSGVTDTIFEFANEGVDTVFASVSYTLPSDVENIVATGAAGVTLTGNTLANILDGSQSALADTLKGLEGNDTYIVGTGDKVIEGRAGTGTTATYTDPGGIDTIISKSTANVDLSPLITDASQKDTIVAGPPIVRTEATGTIAGAISIVGAAFIENVVLDAAAAGADITGNAKDNRLTGNSTAGNTINGGAGNDTLDGGGGGDALTGDAGNDTYIKRHAADTFTESSATGGTDTIISASTINISAVANIENITLTYTPTGINATGNALANIIKGNNTGNVLTGGAGIDTLYGLQGADVLDGGLDNDVMYGGRGDDIYKVNSVGDVVDEVGTLADGTDRVDSFVTYTLNTTRALTVENLTLLGSGIINATGNTLVNLLIGNGAANKLDGGTNADDLRGAAGNDTYVVDNAGDKVTDSFGIDTVQSSVNFNLATGDRLGGDTLVENLILTAGSSATTATGNGLNNIIIGNGNANTITGGDGADTMQGGDGNDTYFIDEIGDIVTDSAGTTDFISTSVTFNLTSAGSGVENITLTGAGVSDLTGNALDNIIIGNGSANTIDGAAGNDTITGVAGADTIDGAAGNDSITGGAGQDAVTTGAGNDTVIFAAGVADTVATAASIAGVDLYSDLVLNVALADKIDLTVTVANVGTEVTGDVTTVGSAFISDMNALLNVAGAGFNTTTVGGISAAVVTVGTGGGAVADGTQFLAVDLDASDTFTATDFVIEITGSTITSLTTASFI